MLDIYFDPSFFKVLKVPGKTNGPLVGIPIVGVLPIPKYAASLTRLSIKSLPNKVTLSLPSTQQVAQPSVKV